jgi:isopenicillin-N epimerase
VGTDDPSPYLCVPAAIDVMGGILPGGWAELRRHNHDLVQAGRSTVAAAIGAPPVVPAELTGSMAIVPLPQAPVGPDGFVPDALQTYLADERHIEAPVTHGPKPDDRWLRISAQAYNSLAEYERLAAALTDWMARQDG